MPALHYGHAGSHAPLAQRQNKLDLFGGITAIDALIKMEPPGVNTAVNSNMFGRYLLSVFPPMGADLELIAEASYVIGPSPHNGHRPVPSHPTPPPSHAAPTTP